MTLRPDDPLKHGKETAVTFSERDHRALCGVGEPLGTYLGRTAPAGIELGLFERHDDDGRSERADAQAPGFRQTWG
ncbi:MAG: hypothetical protein ACXIUM_06125 [Wenzhouxiangella sp.]